MTSERKQTDFKKLVGRIENEYYFLDYIFDEGNFKGATGSVLAPLTKEEFDERVEGYFDTENMRDFWMQAVEAKATDLGLDDWVESVKDDGEEQAIDTSYAESYGVMLKEKLGEEKCYETDCTGGGRCFEPDMKWDEVFDKELLAKIEEVEV